jgi:hypothetical protein
LNRGAAVPHLLLWPIGGATDMSRPAFGLALLTALTSGALAETSPAAPSKRLFDRFPGIVVACQPAPSVRWTVDACPYLIDEMKRRAALSKLPVSVQGYTSDIARKQFGEMDGFNGDKAIRVGLAFKESQSVKGRVELSIASHWVWEPTAKEIPNVAPGQRLPQIFYIGEYPVRARGDAQGGRALFQDRARHVLQSRRRQAVARPILPTRAPRRTARVRAPRRRACWRGGRRSPSRA